MILDATDWAISEFQGTPGLDQRLQQRLVRTASTLVDRPTGSSLPQWFPWTELQPAYRLVDRAASRPDALQAVHRDSTRGVPHEPLTVGRVGYDARRGVVP